MPWIDVDGLSLHHVERPADPGVDRAPDLLLLHGYGTSSRAWEPVLPFLPPGHRVIALDARNHGRSGTSPTASVADNVADVVAVIARLGLHRPVLVGSSIGAVWATEVVRRHGNRIASAVLVGGLAHAAVTVPGVAEANRALVDGYLTDLRGTAERAVPTWFGPLVGPRVHAWMVEQVLQLRVPDPGFIDELARYDPRPHLATIDVPLHYVHGRLDPIPPAVAQQAARLTAGATFTLVEDAAHMPHIEVPGRFADILDTLLHALPMSGAHR